MIASTTATGSTSPGRRFLRSGMRAVVAGASVAALAAAGVGWSVQQRLGTDLVTSDAVTGAPVGAGEAFTALLVGLDARTDAAGNPLPPALLDALHAGPDEGQLHTDTIILLHVPAAAGAPAVAISIPRDSFVPIAGGRGTHKINSAYSRGLADAEDVLRAQGVGGAELDRRGREGGRTALVATVEALAGIRIDHFAEINLAGFVELTTALGGVPVCLNAAVSDTYSGVDLPAGPQMISGPAALAFVRQRHGLDGGDLDRIARQQAFIAGLAQRLRTGGTLTDPGRLAGLVGVVTRHIVIDRRWDVDQALAQLRRLSGDDLSFRTIPTGRPDLPTPVDGVAVQIDRVEVRGFVHRLVSGAAVAGPSVQQERVTGTPTPAVRPSAAAPAGPSTSARPPAAVVARSTATPAPIASSEPPRVITADGITCVD